MLQLQSENTVARFLPNFPPKLYKIRPPFNKHCVEKNFSSTFLLHLTQKKIHQLILE
jgi:hypothetical protein